jgi:hypothetical protein
MELQFDSIHWNKLIEIYQYWSNYSVRSQKIETLLYILATEPAPIGLKLTACENALYFYKTQPKKAICVCALEEGDGFGMTVWYKPHKGYLFSYNDALDLIPDQLRWAIKADEDEEV